MLEFAEHLRVNPNEGSDPTQLAERFGIPVEVVREALLIRSGGAGRRAASAPRDRGLKVDLAWLKGHLERHPLWAIFGFSVAMAFPALLGLPARSYPWMYGLCTLIVLVTAVVTSYFRGQLRYGLPAPFLVATGYMGTIQVISLVHASRFNLRSLQAAGGFLVAGTVVMGTVLAALTVGATFLGALARVRREAAEELRQDRLKLLEQVMQLQDRLETASPAVAVDVSLRERLEWARRNWVAIAAGVGLISFAASGTIMSTVGFPDAAMRTAPALLPLIAASLVMVFEFCLNLFAAFAAGSFLRGVASGLIIQAVGNLSWLIPSDYGGLDRMVQYWTSSPLVWLYFAITLLLSGITGMAAAVERRTYRQARIAVADQAAVLAEMVRLQQILSRGAASVCILAADVAGSTRMKQGEDVLRIELSFRAFQDLVSRVVRAFDGRVFSTAGDGALAQFPDVAKAFAAAQELQAKLGEFNQKVNRLGSPFRIRIGLHYGEVHGDLEKAEFTQVIDVAAHVERASPEGGIALTASAAKELREVALEDGAEAIDGHSIRIWRPAASPHRPA